MPLTASTPSPTILHAVPQESSLVAGLLRDRAGALKEIRRATDGLVAWFLPTRGDLITEYKQRLQIWENGRGELKSIADITPVSRRMATVYRLKEYRESAQKCRELCQTALDSYELYVADPTTLTVAFFVRFPAAEVACNAKLIEALFEVAYKKHEVIDWTKTVKKSQLQIAAQFDEEKIAKTGALLAAVNRSIADLDELLKDAAVAVYTEEELTLFNGACSQRNQSPPAIKARFKKTLVSRFSGTKLTKQVEEVYGKYETWKQGEKKLCPPPLHAVSQTRDTYRAFLERRAALEEEDTLPHLYVVKHLNDTELQGQFFGEVADELQKRGFEVTGNEAVRIEILNAKYVGPFDTWVAEQGASAAS